MNAKELINQANRIKDVASHCGDAALSGTLAEATEFLRTYVGERNAFYKLFKDTDLSQVLSGLVRRRIIGNMEAFVRYVENDLLDSVSIERRAQIDVVSDFLEQAQILLDTKEVHPAAPTVIIGAVLEEYLRNWVEEADLDLKGKKPNLDSYKSALREAELIDKQDAKDIVAWSGLRNCAAHGEWDKVDDKNRIGLMLEGVNLFMRKHQATLTVT